MIDFQSLLILLVVVWLLGHLCRYLRLPVIFGELLGGILVGPLVFGWIEVNNELIFTLAELGAFFLMLHAGLQTNPRQLLHMTKHNLTSAFVDTLLPFAAVAAVCYFMLGLSPAESLFAGVATSATAIVITSRSLKENKITDSNLVTHILGTSVFAEVLVLVLFSVVLQLTVTGFSWWGLWLILAKVVCFIAVVVVGGELIQPYVEKYTRRKGFTFTLILGFGMGLLAEVLGLHMILGAFLAGVLVREEVLDEKLFAKIEDRVYGISYSFLGPIFFASLAFSLQPGWDWIATPTFVGIFLTAYGVKLIASTYFSWRYSSSWESALISGFALNNRGIVDLIIATVGLQTGILDQELFAIIIGIAFLSMIISNIALRFLSRGID